MTDNKVPKLRKSRAEASEKIRSRINMGKELFERQIFSEEEFAILEQETRKWIEYNKRLFDSLFDESPLPWSHGSTTTYTIKRSLNIEISDHWEHISRWINDLESIYEQLELYEELPNRAQQTTSNGTTNNENKKIFIGHGRSHAWRELSDFIVNTLGLEYEEFERISAAGKSINNHLEEMLNKSCMAFLIMTGEDEYSNSSIHARPNVIHEIGKCQDRFGSERAIILLEKGCEKFSNVDGIVYIDFAKGNIKESFGEIVKVLIRESIIEIELGAEVKGESKVVGEITYRSIE